MNNINCHHKAKSYVFAVKDKTRYLNAKDLAIAAFENVPGHRELATKNRAPAY
jgi:hypothetical protein